MTGRPSDAIEPLERYVDRPELAELLGISISTIKRWQDEGMPYSSWGSSRIRRYRPSKVIAWAEERRRMRESRDRSNGPGQPQPKE